MFIEINNLRKAKKFLDLNYNSSCKNNLNNMKYIHMIDCLEILKFYNLFDYFKYGAAVLLHDIGRFYESNFENTIFNHAEYGYELLKKEFTNDPIVLLAVRYHEADLKWKEFLNNDYEFLNCSKKKKKQIIKSCMLVRDVDIISNMKKLISQNNKNIKIEKINENMINKLYNNEIGIKEDINNEYDEITYILCGLNLITFNQSFSYMRKNKIINELKKRQLNMILDDKKKYDSTIKMYSFINKKFKL